MKYLKLPIHLIARIEKKVLDVRTFILELYAKDRRECKLQFVREEDLNEIVGVLDPLIFPVSTALPSLFLHSHGVGQTTQNLQWKQWDP